MKLRWEKLSLKKFKSVAEREVSDNEFDNSNSWTSGESDVEYFSDLENEIEFHSIDIKINSYILLKLYHEGNHCVCLFYVAKV